MAGRRGGAVTKKVKVSARKSTDSKAVKGKVSTPQQAPDQSNKNSVHSHLRERIVEHLFLGSMLRELWSRDILDIEVLRSEFDAHGYDVVLARGQLVRHVQLRTRGHKNRPGKVSVCEALGLKPSGCVIVISINDKLDLGPFYWFGGDELGPLPEITKYPLRKSLKRTGNGERPNRKRHRDVPGSKFVKVENLDGIIEKLLGKGCGSAPKGNPAASGRKALKRRH